MPHRLRPTILASVLLAGLLPAQCPPGAAMPLDVALETTLPTTGPARTRVDTGLATLAAGDAAAARQHLVAALEFHPSSPEILLELVCASADDPDLVALWAERFVRAATDGKGKLKIDAATRKRLGAIAGANEQLKSATPFAAQRTAAVQELARFVERQKPAKKDNAARALLVRWASGLLLQAGQGAPQAIGEVSGGVRAVQDAFEPDYDVVYEALAKVLSRPLPNAAQGDGPTTGVASDVATVQDQRVRAARVLAGLARQVAFKDLQGPRPAGPGAHGDAARRLLEDERQRAVADGKVWTIDELEAMSDAEAVLFTEQHRDWHSPGIALSTTGRYRVETICGHQTLLGAAKTVELHHARLVDHFGKDPFVDRQGIVRIVPESSELETEGAPYWWAGGFQAGDRTTVRFAWGNIPGLGRTLTHELTHRFDGVLRPFLPAWYVEGHADWTGAHYAKMADAKFVEDFLKRGTVAHTFYKGYGGRKNFEKLLLGEVDDYRDNYFAGYSLYAFLTSYPPGQPRYRGALERFEQNARAGQKDPIGYFTKTFCDGKEGRPADLDALHDDWQTFVRGCYEWQDGKRAENAWVGQYGALGEGDPAPMVMDAPTWTWARDRAEPFYGQDHAAAATLLLDEVGDVDGTIAAGVWSLTVDGWRPEVACALAKALRASRHTDAAAAFAALAHQRFADIEYGEGTGLLAALPKTKALLGALATRAEALSAAKHAVAAVASESEHAALAAWFGTATTLPDGASKPALPRHLGSMGFAESGLTGFEDRRREGLWYVTPEGDLHVGREKPREATGVLDRRAQQRDAFAHSVLWLEPGRYVVRGRVHFTTSFVSGAIVFGHTRRDRDTRLTFRSGDFAYATGRSEQNDRKGRIGFGLNGLWERDGNDKLPGTSPSQSVEVPDEQNWFEYELHVDGPRVLVVVNGEPLFRYAVHDGTPIEGRVGFATSMGAIRVQQPTVQRLDTLPGETTTGLDVAKPTTATLDDLMLLPTRGLPRNPDGTLVLWLPKVDEGSPAQRLDRSLRALSKLLQTAHEHPQPWLLAVPANMDADERRSTVAAIQDLRPGDLPIVEHHVTAPLDGNYPWVLFVDAQGVLRVAADCRDVKLHTRLTRWSRILRRR